MCMWTPFNFRGQLPSTYMQLILDDLAIFSFLLKAVQVDVIDCIYLYRLRLQVHLVVVHSANCALLRHNAQLLLVHSTECLKLGVRAV